MMCFTSLNLFARGFVRTSWIKSLSSQKILKYNASSASSMSMKATGESKYGDWYEEALPRITVPSKMMRRIERSRAKAQDKKEKLQMQTGSGPPIISCKRAQFNHFIGQQYPKGDLTKFLATSGWKHKRSAGDWMIFQPFMNLPAFHRTVSESFKDLHIQPQLIRALDEMCIVEPTYIQEKAIPEMMSGKNCLIAAETGSGKTLAYLVPMIQRIVSMKSNVMNLSDNSPLGVILAPSRELIAQIKAVCEKLCQPFNLTVEEICRKGNSAQIRQSVDILIASPGALAPLVHHKVYNLAQVQTIVLDEGDTLMDDSFSDEVVEIIQQINLNTEVGTLASSGIAQISIASATMPTGVRNILGDLIDMNAISVVKTPKLHVILPHVKQRFDRVKPSEKSDFVVDAIKSNLERSRPTLVFCNSPSSACHIAYRLEDLKLEHCLLTGKLPDRLRNGRFEAFQSGSCDVMVATDIASRGLDTRRVKHVINYDFPNFMSDYLHRIGRIGRVGSPSKCMATSYITKPWEVELLWQIETSIRAMKTVQDVDANIKKALVTRKHGKLAPLVSDDMFVDDDN